MHKRPTAGSNLVSLTMVGNGIVAVAVDVGADSGAEVQWSVMTTVLHSGAPAGLTFAR